MTERGTQALAVRSTDFFSEAISGWLETIAETLNRFAVPRLFQINAASFAGITGFPTIEFGPVGQLDVQKLMDAISKASAAGALKLEVDDERTVRQALELPELTDDMLKERERRKAEMAKQMASAPQPPPGGGNEKKPDLGKDGDEGQQFAAVRGAGAGQLRTWERATNDYQRWLGENYGGWARQLARDLSEAESEDDYDDIINEALAALAVAMRQAGRENITRTLGLVGGGAATPRLLASVSQLIEDNETAIDSSLVPAIRSRLQSGLRDPDIQATGFVAILGLLAGFGARVESYAGGMWSAIQHAAGEAATSATAEGTGEVRWNRDAQAAHCEDCLQFGDRTYESFDAMLAETGNRVPGQVKCDGNCRCWLEVNLDGEFARP
jgi:hypothetical protein